MLEMLTKKLFCAQNRVSYRRLLAFLVATALLMRGVIDSTVWMVVTSVFIGIEGVERALQPRAASATPPAALPDSATVQEDGT